MNSEIITTRILRQLGVPANIYGYHYMREAVMIAVEDFHVINHVIRELYPVIAKKYNTTRTRVERAIRHAIDIAWCRGDTETIKSMFSHTICNERGKPTNSEFIAMIADEVRLELKAAKAKDLSSESN